MKRDLSRALLHEIPFIKESFGVSLDQPAVAKSYDRDSRCEEKHDHEIQMARVNSFETCL
jgi:hypothetical protein